MKYCYLFLAIFGFGVFGYTAYHTVFSSEEPVPGINEPVYDKNYLCSKFPEIEKAVRENDDPNWKLPDTIISYCNRV